MIQGNRGEGDSDSLYVVASMFFQQFYNACVFLCLASSRSGCFCSLINPVLRHTEKAIEKKWELQDYVVDICVKVVR